MNPPLPRILRLEPALRERLDEAAAKLAAARDGLEANERALGALPGSAWERAPEGPRPGEAAALRADRRRLLEAMWTDLAAIDEARRSVRRTAALAVVRERNFEAAAPLRDREQEWKHHALLHAACVQVERALLRLDARLGAMGAEDRAEVVALTRALRASAAWARAQIALLPRLPASDRTALAQRLHEALGAAWEQLRGMEGLVVRHGGPVVWIFHHPPPAAEEEEEDDDDDARARALPERTVARLRRVLSRLVPGRGRGTLAALCDVQRAWGAELIVMGEAIRHHTRNDRAARRGGAAGASASMLPRGDAN